jgi:ubiquitin carboxyl-terminal hydrolase 5/13
LQVTPRLDALISCVTARSRHLESPLTRKYCSSIDEHEKFIGLISLPSGWKCEKCDLTNNLWLNLTDGSILCGRRYYDGSGGNNHAVEHYELTKYPLAVKLGTITADGAGKVEETDYIF